MSPRIESAPEPGMLGKGGQCKQKEGCSPGMKRFHCRWEDRGTTSQAEGPRVAGLVWMLQRLCVLWGEHIEGMTGQQSWVLNICQCPVYFQCVPTASRTHLLCCVLTHSVSGVYTGTPNGMCGKHWWFALWFLNFLKRVIYSSLLVDCGT